MGGLVGADDWLPSSSVYNQKLICILYSNLYDQIVHPQFKRLVKVCGKVLL